jgi:hypothetical protein
MNRTITLRSLCLAAFMASALLCAAEEKYPGPKDPAAPAVDQGGKRADLQSWVRVALARARGERIEGELLVSFASLDLPVPGEKHPAKKQVALADISSIEFVRWRGQARNKNEYAFYHSEVRVTLADKTVVLSAMNIRALNRLRVRNGDRVRSLYTYFLDYRDKDAWRNSGQKEMKYPETNPHADTVVSITFLHEPEAGLLDLFFKGLKKQ